MLASSSPEALPETVPLLCNGKLHLFDRMIFVVIVSGKYT